MTGTFLHLAARAADAAHEAAVIGGTRLALALRALDRALERAEHAIDQARGLVWLCRLWVRP